MGQPRSELQAILVTFCNHVYFQPPPSIQMSYPCIVYTRDFEDTQFAGNLPYRRDKRYQVTVIDEDPDSLIPDKVGQLPKSAFIRSFVADKLNHDVFSVYF
jgi:hypothetical protein